MLIQIIYFHVVLVVVFLGGETINMPVSTYGSGTPTTRPKSGYPVYDLGAGGMRGAIEIVCKLRNV